MNDDFRFPPECEYYKIGIWTESLRVALGADDYAHEECRNDKELAWIKELLS